KGALWLLPSGVAVAGIGIALAADAPSYPLVLLLVLASGLGVAAFHPEGSKFAAYASGRRRASGMSLFSVGGHLGYALGPVIAPPLVVAFGRRGGLLLAAPCLVVALVLFVATRFLGTFVPELNASGPREGENQPRAMTLLLGVVAFRTISWFGPITF